MCYRADSPKPAQSLYMNIGWDTFGWRVRGSSWLDAHVEQWAKRRIFNSIRDLLFEFRCPQQPCSIRDNCEDGRGGNAAACKWD